MRVLGRGQRRPDASCRRPHGDFNNRNSRLGRLRWRRTKNKDTDKEAGVYRIVDVIGVSTVSWDDAAKRAVETAAKSLRDLRIAEVIKMDLKVEDGKVLAYRTKLALSFKYEE